MKRRVITLAAAVCFVSSLAFAGDTWTLDSGTSNARLFQGSRANPNSVNTSIARMTGKVTVDTNNPVDSIFNLGIYPEGEDWGYALSPEGTSPFDYVSNPTDQVLLTFKSTRILRIGNGKLEVVGDLSLIRLERNITATPTEAYAGAVYGDPAIHIDTREVTLVFPSVSSALLGSQNKDAVELVGTTRVSHEEFPQLLSAINETNWPSVVRDEDCQNPSTVGEDYSGPVCTATLIAAVSHDHCHMPASVGEDYSGSLCTQAAGNQTTIALHLKLLHTAPEPSVGMLPGNGATQ